MPSPAPSAPSRSRALVLLLVFGVFGGGTAWVLHLTLSFAVVPLICAREDATLLHLLTVGLALMAAGAVLASIQAYRLAGREGRGEVDRFLAATGLILSGFFLGLVLAEGIPALVQGDPCRAVPTQDRPIIQSPDAPPDGTPLLQGGLPIQGTWVAGVGTGGWKRGTSGPTEHLRGAGAVPTGIPIRQPGGIHGGAVPT